MARKRRSFSIFSLSFLDIMSCGFGATILVFLVMDHASEVRSEEVDRGAVEAHESSVVRLGRLVLDCAVDLADGPFDPQLAEHAQDALHVR